jgi:hypothetical protein
VRRSFALGDRYADRQYISRARFTIARFKLADRHHGRYAVPITLRPGARDWYVDGAGDVLPRVAGQPCMASGHGAKRPGPA